MRPANERWPYNVTSSLTGWAHTENYPCKVNILFPQVVAEAGIQLISPREHNLQIHRCLFSKLFLAENQWDGFLWVLFVCCYSSMSEYNWFRKFLGASQQQETIAWMVLTKITKALLQHWPIPYNTIVADVMGAQGAGSSAAMVFDLVCLEYSSLITQRVNSLRPSDPYMRQQTLPSLVLIMVCGFNDLMVNTLGPSDAYMHQ